MKCLGVVCHARVVWKFSYVCLFGGNHVDFEQVGWCMDAHVSASAACGWLPHNQLVACAGWSVWPRNIPELCLLDGLLARLVNP